MDFYICARSWNQSPMDTEEQLAVQREMNSGVKLAKTYMSSQTVTCMCVCVCVRVCVCVGNT